MLASSYASSLFAYIKKNPCYRRFNCENPVKIDFKMKIKWLTVEFSMHCAPHLGEKNGKLITSYRVSTLATAIENVNQLTKRYYTNELKKTLPLVTGINLPIIILYFLLENHSFAETLSTPTFFRFHFTQSYRSDQNLSTLKLSYIPKLEYENF